MTKLEKLRPGYSTAAIIWLNACLLFLFICVALGAIFFVSDRLRASGADHLSNARAIHSMTASDAQKLFHDFELLGSTPVFRPWIGFSEPTWYTPSINIDPADPVPVRRTPPPAAGVFRDEKVIWLFGGSTAMGYGLPDQLTLSAQLQDELQRAFPTSRIVVVNHGHLGYFSSQEITLFQWLLRSGKRASFAVFVDGLNDAGYELDKPDIDFRGTISAATQPFVTFSARFPPVRLFNALRKRVTHERPANDIPRGAELPVRIDTVERRYLTNVKLAHATAEAFGMQTLFVWQPTPFDSINTRASDPEVQRIHRFLGFEPVLKPLNARFRNGLDQPGFVFLADIFASDLYIDTYLDAAHYGDTATRKLARAIAQRITAHPRLRQ